MTLTLRDGWTPDFWGTCELKAFCAWALAEVQPRVQGALKIGTREARAEVMDYITGENLLRYSARWHYSHSGEVERALKAFMEKERRGEAL